MTDSDEMLQVAMQLIIHGGNAKGQGLLAIKAAKAGNFDEAEAALAAGHQALKEAHDVQTGLLTDAANGVDVPLNLYLIHGQDHLMAGITTLDLATEIVDVYRKLEEK